MYPRAYIEFLVYFHGNRDYFECHEVLEEHWKSESLSNPIWVGLIQIAVSLYHHRRGNYTGAARMMDSAIGILQSMPVETLALDRSLLFSLLNERLTAMKQKMPYLSIDLPLTDAKLLHACKELAFEKGYSWGESSKLDDPFLIHKHRLRDRSEVIAERARAKEQKNRLN